MLGHNNIILIDDDPIFNFINSKVIQTTKLGFVVHIFDKAFEALDELSNIARSDANDYRCIIFVDINMPGVNGWEFLERFTLLPASLIDSCRVFMLSSSNDASDIERSATYKPVKGFISKPLTRQHVIDISTEMYSSINIIFPG